MKPGRIAVIAAAVLFVAAAAIAGSVWPTETYLVFLGLVAGLVLSSDTVLGALARAWGSEPAAKPTARRHRVCLSGSMRFEEEMRAAAIEESLAGHIVVMPHVNLRRSDISGDEAEHVKADLDALHLDKVDLADEVLVICPGNYIGESTQAEITYAQQQGKPVRYRTGSLIEQEGMQS